MLVEIKSMYSVSIHPIFPASDRVNAMIASCRRFGQSRQVKPSYHGHLETEQVPSQHMNGFAEVYHRLGKRSSQ